MIDFEFVFEDDLKQAVVVVVVVDVSGFLELFDVKKQSYWDFFAFVCRLGSEMDSEQGSRDPATKKFGKAKGKSWEEKKIPH